MITGKFLGGDTDLSDIFFIRREVFCNELGEPENEVFDGKDTLAMHAVVLDNENNPAATGRAIFENGRYKLGFICVLKEKRGSCYGDFVVRMLCDRAFNSGAKEVYLEARQNAVDFYKNIGFRVCGEASPITGFIPMVLSVQTFGCGHNCK